MKAYQIARIMGDGIGPEIVSAACAVLDAAGQRLGATFCYTDYLAGGCAIDAVGVPLPEATVAGCLAGDSVILGAVGGPKWDNLPGHLRPERALLGIRAALGLYANLRPARLFPALANASPLKARVLENGMDIMIVRELTGGIYFGKSGKDGDTAYDTEAYSVPEIERIGRVAFRLAQKRRGKVTSIDKANVLESSRLWRKTMHGLSAQFPQVAYEDMLVDNAAMQLIRSPGRFDVVVTSNMFGDILSDEAAELTGSIGILPSASLGDGTLGLYEPIHGSAPDIAGQNKANPIATILSLALMLRYSLHLEAGAAMLETAVLDALTAGYRTADIAENGCEKLVTTRQMAEKIISFLA